MAKKKQNIEVKVVEPEMPSIATKIEKLESELEKLSKKESKILFWVVDCKGNPSGAIANIYVMAHMLKDLGYDVTMLYQAEKDEEWVGPGDFIGEKYNQLTHANILKDKVLISISDLLIIPELFVTSKKKNTDGRIVSVWKEIPCKKVVLCQNFNYLPEFMPIGEEFGALGIIDVITTSETQKRLLLELMPYLKIKIIEPSIAPYFYKSSDEKNLQVAIVAKDRSDVNKIAKLFYLKNPLFRFLTFKHLNGLNQELFAEEIRSSIAVVWVDRDTNFGYAPIEAIKSGTIVIGLVPDEPVDWMLQENGKDLSNAIIWVDNLNKVHSAILAIVSSFMEDQIPDNFKNEMGKFDTKFTRDQQKLQLQRTIKEYLKDRAQELQETITIFKNQENVKSNNEKTQ